MQCARCKVSESTELFDLVCEPIYLSAPPCCICSGAAYSHGGMKGISKMSFKHVTLLKYLNAFLRHHLPDTSWSSVMVSFNRCVFPCRDHHNDKNSSNHLVCVGPYEGGGLDFRNLTYYQPNSTAARTRWTSSTWPSGTNEA